MRKTLVLTFLLLVATIGVQAQPKTFIEVGASGVYSTSYDPSDAKRHDGGQIFPGAYVRVGYDLRHGLQALALVEYQSRPSYNSIFTSDTNTGRTATSELRFRAGARYQFDTERFARPFIEAGAEKFHQFFKSTLRVPPLPDPLPPGPLPTIAAYGEYEAHDFRLESAGLNPYVSVGVNLGEYSEISATRLFEDQISRSGLSGYRAAYFYTHPLGGWLALRAGAEVDYVKFRDSVGDYVGAYDKRDVRALVRLGLVIH